MLNVLLESNVTRTRRTGGTLASTLVHAALLAGAITVSTRPPLEKPVPGDVIAPPVFVTPPTDPVPQPVIRHTTTLSHPAGPISPPFPVVDVVPTGIQPIDPDVKVPITTYDDFSRGVTGQVAPTDGRRGALGAPEGALEERYVDRGPRMLGSPVPPAFPASLRQQGRDGRVLVQFVVDTLGRAEMSGLRVVQASDSLFAQSVRAVLPRYRFSPGEVGGQKVRTLVQLPFDFTLVR